ncbi:hypothetical protein F4808DRAFT_465990 [Astrocystis sublimbata]|nr:hypothetical protein F4808DRAFT_465990 [Astrocystis sublimbata]
MVCATRFCISKEKRKRPGISKQMISSPVEGSFRRLTPEIYPVAAFPLRPPSHNQYNNESYFEQATTSIAPQERGREEIMGWLDTGAPDSLAALREVIHNADKQARRRPKAKGKKEVQLTLEKPSHEAVNMLHRVHSEAARFIRYSAAIYNFSKSGSWNCVSPTRKPSLQVRDTRVKLCPPLNWLELPQPEHLPHYDISRSSSPISEPGGWRDIDQETSDLRPNSPRMTTFEERVWRSIQDSGEDREDEEECESNNSDDVPPTPSVRVAQVARMISARNFYIRDLKPKAS